MIQIKSSELKSFRQKMLKDQNYKDAITGKDLRLEDSVVDHQHRRSKKSEIGLNGDGLIRGVIDRNVNLAEGKIWNSLQRYLGIKTTQERIEFLEKLIEYYKKGTTEFIHPSEKIPVPDLSKSNYNKVKKLALKDSKKMPDYPKSGKLTKTIKKFFDFYKINYYN